MMNSLTFWRSSLTILAMTGWLTAADPLPSWNDGPAKQGLVSFVTQVTTAGGPAFTPPAERIAVFDNDGTLWGEQPLYVQLAFALDRVRSLAPQHPEWHTREPFATLLAGDTAKFLAGGERALMTVVMATHAGLTTEEFSAIVSEWLATAQHPVTKRPYTEMVYQPMLEVLDYLRAQGFKTYIVSGGGVEFMRPWTERVYGIPPEQVIGSSIKTTFEVRAGTPVLVRSAEIDFIDDQEGKPVAIQKHIGRRPLAAFGNSDGDLAMLQWTAAGPGPRLAFFVQHTDAEREWAYDRTSSIGRLDKGLDEARARGWLIADMKRDWKTIYPLPKTSWLQLMPAAQASCCEAAGGRAGLLARTLATQSNPAVIPVP
jgi:phosphoserine phosphatase